MRLYFITSALFIALLLGCCAMGYDDTQEAQEMVYYSEDGA
jgi:hypothetical protein